MRARPEIEKLLEPGDSSELAPGLPCKGKSVRNRGVSQTMPFFVIPRSKLRGGFISFCCFGAAITFLLGSFTSIYSVNPDRVKYL
jgi:hypothetical protein